ncbi:MAG: hypothetical protein JWN70_1479 [Planctomycetaceae bacterium]|nr:hypothetical protein [Planctomycetaceae bacterium]
MTGYSIHYNSVLPPYVLGAKPQLSMNEQRHTHFDKVIVRGGTKCQNWEA